MKTELQRWWHERSERERWMLSVLGIIAALMIAWFAVVQPVRGAASAAEARHLDAAGQLAEVRASAAALGDAAARPRAAGAVQDIVQSSASAAGLEFGATRGAEGGGIVVSIAAVRPTFLFGWIATLERDKGVRVTQLSVERNGDQTVAAEIGFAGPGA